MQKNELIRYVINGLVATLVHYIILNFNIIILDLSSVGISNFIAAIFGISTSFVGNRYYVFKKHTNSLISQIIRFGLLYIFIAILHGCILYVWSDKYRLSYHLGFLVATSLQVLLSYLGNKILVFKNEI